MLFWPTDGYSPPRELRTMKDLILFSCDSSPPAFAITERAEISSPVRGYRMHNFSRLLSISFFFCPVSSSPSDTSPSQVGFCRAEREYDCPFVFICLR